MAHYLDENRKLKLEEYDNDGNLIEVREFNRNDIANFLCMLANEGRELEVAKKKDLALFSEEEKKVLDDIYYYRRYDSNLLRKAYLLDDKATKYFRNLFNTHGIEAVKLAINIARDRHTGGGFNVTPKSEYYCMKWTLESALDFIKNRAGIFYTVDSEGKRVYDFVDKPTKKQVAYQRNKNGHRTVFLNFKNWKEYLVLERVSSRGKRIRKIDKKNR